MFAIDRQQNRAMLAHRVHEQLAGHDQHFLVGQQDFLARPGRRQRRLQPRRADNGRHHRIDVRMRRHVDQRLHAVTHRSGQPGVAATQSEFSGQRRVAHHRKFRRELADLLEQLVDLGMRAQRKYPVTIGMATNDVERIDPDRSGGTENRDFLAFHHPCPRATSSQSSATTGNVEVRLSMRSSTPPWPGSTLLLSLMPAWRLSIDS